MVFVNFTNHPADTWDSAQLSAARKYGEIAELAFPVVNSRASEKDIAALADVNFGKRRTAGEAIGSDTGQFPFHFADLGAIEGMLTDRAGAVNFKDERHISV